jgi:hypothetical protein
MATTTPLVCRSCATSHPLNERFCPTCGMPLVYAPDVAAGGRPITEQHERARKVKPQYAEGELVRVAWARNQAEAEMLAGLLLEEGIPSLIQRNAGFDVPDFLAAGPRDLLVAASGASAARDVLGLDQPAVTPRPPRRPAPRWVRGLAGVMIAVVALSTLAGLVLALVL